MNMLVNGVKKSVSYKIWKSGEEVYNIDMAETFGPYDGVETNENGDYVCTEETFQGIVDFLQGISDEDHRPTDEDHTFVNSAVFVNSDWQ